jgi:integration host factor subunit beta
MTRSQLIEAIAEQNPQLDIRIIEKIVINIFDEIVDALRNKKRVELRGFGAFSVKNRESRTARNPRTGESIEVKAKCLPFFKPGKQIKERLNRS